MNHNLPLFVKKELDRKYSTKVAVCDSKKYTTLFFRCFAEIKYTN